MNERMTILSILGFILTSVFVIVLLLPTLIIDITTDDFFENYAIAEKFETGYTTVCIDYWHMLDLRSKCIIETTNATVDYSGDSIRFVLDDVCTYKHLEDGTIYDGKMDNVYYCMNQDGSHWFSKENWNYSILVWELSKDGRTFMIMEHK